MSSFFLCQRLFWSTFSDWKLLWSKRELKVAALLIAAPHLSAAFYDDFKVFSFLPVFGLFAFILKHLFCKVPFFIWPIKQINSLTQKNTTLCWAGHLKLTNIKIWLYKEQYLNSNKNTYLNEEGWAVSEKVQGLHVWNHILLVLSSS